jgi:hypothetical protein
MRVRHNGESKESKELVLSVRTRMVVDPGQ